MRDYSSAGRGMSDTQSKVREVEWAEIESQLHKTQKGISVKDQNDILTISENLYRILKEEKPDSHGKAIKPSTVVAELTSTPEESTKKLSGHWAPPGNKAKLIKKLNFRFLCLEKLAELTGENSAALKLKMFEGTSYLKASNRAPSLSLGELSLARVLNEFSEKISLHHGLKDYFDNYHKYDFRGDPSRADQIYREIDSFMGTGFDNFKFDMIDGVETDIMLTWAFPRVTLARKFITSYPAILCVDKECSIPNELWYEGKSIATGWAWSATSFSGLTNAITALENSDTFEIFPVFGRVVEEFNWTVIPNKDGDRVGTFEVRKGHLFANPVDEWSQERFKIKPDIEKVLMKFKPELVMRNFSTAPNVEIENLKTDHVHRALILPLDKDNLSMVHEDMSESVDEEFLLTHSHQHPRYHYISDDSLYYLQQHLSPNGNTEFYLGENTFPVTQRAGWHASSIVAQNWTSYGSAGDGYTPVGDSVDGYPVNTFLSALEHNLYDQKRMTDGNRIVDLLNYDAQVKVRNFRDRFGLLTKMIDEKRLELIDSFSPEDALPKEIKE